MNIKKEFGEKIKKIRKKQNLTQEQLAEIIEISPRNLSGIEIGQNFIKSETLEKILNALDVSLEELFSSEYFEENDVLLSEIQKNIKKIQGNRQKLLALSGILKYIANN